MMQNNYLINFNNHIMQELIDRLTQNANISPEQAAKAIETIKEYVKEKFPMLGGAVDNLLGGASANSQDI
jgi:DNA modification methylase